MNFDKTAVVGKYEVKVSTENMRGYFEHEEYGDERGGGLWFDRVQGRIELSDYDGMACLPKQVVSALRSLNIHVDEDFE